MYRLAVLGLAAAVQAGVVPRNANSTAPVETSFTTYLSTCTENGTAVLHTHSAPITTTTSSSLVISSSSVPISTTSTGSSSSNSTLFAPVTAFASSASETQYTTFTSLCTENGTAILHTHSAPITATTNYNGSATASTASPVGTGLVGTIPSRPSDTFSNSANSSLVAPVTASVTSASETHFTTFLSTRRR